MPHRGVGLHVAISLVIHHAKVSTAECLRYGERNLGLSGDHLGSLVLGLGFEFLLDRYGQGASFLRLGRAATSSSLAAVCHPAYTPPYLS